VSYDRRNESLDRFPVAADSQGRMHMSYDRRNESLDRFPEISSNVQPGMTSPPDQMTLGRLVESKIFQQYGTPVLAEFVGTFIFVFIGAGSIVANAFLSGTVGLIGIALAHGLALSVVVSALGATSGAHINPAVTIGFLVTRRIIRLLGILYILAQLLGATLAGLLLKAIFPEAIWQAARLGTPGLAPNISSGTAILIEAILTFFLLLAVFGTAVDDRAPKIGGFGIGLTVLADIFVGGPLTGAAMNPARTFGPALAGGFWDNNFVYWVGPIIGAIIAALFYEYVILRPRRDSHKAAV
jgi:MIP family channel proteins